MQETIDFARNCINRQHRLTVEGVTIRIAAVTPLVGTKRGYLIHEGVKTSIHVLIQAPDDVEIKIRREGDPVQSGLPNLEEEDANDFL